MIGGEIIRFQSDQIQANKCISWNFDHQKVALDKVEM